MRRCPTCRRLGARRDFRACHGSRRMPSRGGAELQRHGRSRTFATTHGERPSTPGPVAIRCSASGHRASWRSQGRHVGPEPRVHRRVGFIVAFRRRARRSRAVGSSPDHPSQLKPCAQASRRGDPVTWKRRMGTGPEQPSRSFRYGGRAAGGQGSWPTFPASASPASCRASTVKRSDGGKRDGTESDGSGRPTPSWRGSGGSSANPGRGMIVEAARGAGPGLGLSAACRSAPAPRPEVSAAAVAATGQSGETAPEAGRPAA